MPATMTAMLLDAPHQPLRLATVPVPRPREHEVLIQVRACGVCRTDLHILDGDLGARLLP
jgi:propanol-preferring alcohol dehydrogenase